MIPSIHRFLGTELLKQSMVTPMAAQPATGLTPAKPATLEPIKHTQLAMPPATNSGAVSNLNTKTSTIGESILRALPMVAEDGIDMLARNVLKGGATAMAVPAGVEKARTEFDPSYQANPIYGNSKRILNTLSKIGLLLAGDSNGMQAPDNQTGFYAPYTPQPPWNDVNTKQRINSAIDGTFGAQYVSPHANLSDTEVGSSPKIAGAGGGTLQGDLSENRGGNGSYIDQMPNHNRAFLAGNSMTTEDTVNQTWDRLRAYLRDDTANMNMPNDAAVGQDI